MKVKPFYRPDGGGICFYEDNPPITAYVNPHTGELCLLKYVEDTHERSILALKGQGVKHLGTWYPGHFQNWGYSEICREWTFSGYAASARYLERALTNWVNDFNSRRPHGKQITLGG